MAGVGADRSRSVSGLCIVHVGEPVAGRLCGPGLSCLAHWRVVWCDCRVETGAIAGCDRDKPRSRKVVPNSTRHGLARIWRRRNGLSVGSSSSAVRTGPTVYGPVMPGAWPRHARRDAWGRSVVTVGAYCGDDGRKRSIALRSVSAGRYRVFPNSTSGVAINAGIMTFAGNLSPTTNSRTSIRLV